MLRERWSTMRDDLVDAELVRRVAEGDVDAVAALYDRHASLLFAIALRVLRDRAEAEDVVHDVFVGLRARAMQFTSERGTASSWICAIARNLSIDRARRGIRQGTLARERLAHEPSVGPSTPEQLTSEVDEESAIRRALAALPETHRRTLELAFFEGLTYPDIAARDDVPLGTVKSRAARALTALRDALAREGLSYEQATVEPR